MVSNLDPNDDDEEFSRQAEVGQKTNYKAIFGIILLAISFFLFAAGMYWYYPTLLAGVALYQLYKALAVE